MIKKISKEMSNGLSVENEKGIENHKMAARHHENAAKYHLDAARHHEAGRHEQASDSAIKAYGHHYLACEAQREDVKHHALNEQPAMKK